MSSVLLLCCFTSQISVLYSDLKCICLGIPHFILRCKATLCCVALTVVWGGRVVNGSFPEQTSVAYYAPDAVVISWATGEQSLVY